MFATKFFHYFFCIQSFFSFFYRRRKRTVFTCKMYVCTVPYLLVCTPVPYLPHLFQGVSASDLPTKSISLIPTKDPGTNLRLRESDLAPSGYRNDTSTITLDTTQHDHTVFWLYYRHTQRRPRKITAHHPTTPPTTQHTRTRTTTRPHQNVERP